MSNERSDAINAYVEHIKTLTDNNGRGYDAHERTLLAIGYVQGWEAAVQAERERAAEILDGCNERNAKLAKRLDNVEAGREIEQTALRNAIGRMERACLLADVSGWHVYESQDTGDVYPAAPVQDLVADIRAALDETDTP